MSNSSFQLWVDAVGGYLVCLDPEVVIGLPGPEVALGIRADLSRRHAILRREQGEYVLEPLGPVAVDGRPVTSPMLLGREHLLELGSGVQLRFVQPHALSSSARLTVVSRHRAEPGADGMVLMADSLVLGPQPHCHIECRPWLGEVMLYRQREQLCCRAWQPMAVDGVASSSPATLKSDSRVEGETFAFSLEPIGK